MAIDIDVDFVVVADNQFIILNCRATLDLAGPLVTWMVGVEGGGDQFQICIVEA